MYLYTCMYAYLSQSMCVICIYSFCAGDPLLISGRRSDKALVISGGVNPRECFWAAYVKGMARSCTTLTLLDQCLVNEIDLDAVCPNLLHLVKRIHARRHIASDDLASIALANAQLSSAGSIRKEHDVITWLGKLVLLRTQGADPGAIIARWNSMSSVRSQLNGQKRVCLLNLLEKAPTETVDFLINLASQVAERLFPEEAFANKKILPG